MLAYTKLKRGEIASIFDRQRIQTAPQIPGRHRPPGTQALAEFSQLLPGRPFAALEPMTVPTDALTDGSVPVVAPGDAFSASFVVEVR